MTVGFVPLFLDEFSKTVGFVFLREFHDGWNLRKKIDDISMMVKDSQFCSIRDFKDGQFFFCYESLIMVDIYEKNVQNFNDGRFVRLWDLNDGRFCSVMRFQWLSVFCFVTSVSWWSKFIEKIYEISMIVGFVRLCDLNDGRFCSFVPLRDFKDGRLGDEISKMVGLVHLWNLNDGRFCFVIRV